MQKDKILKYSVLFVLVAVLTIILVFIFSYGKQILKEECNSFDGNYKEEVGILGTCFTKKREIEFLYLDLNGVDNWKDQNIQKQKN